MEELHCDCSEDSIWLVRCYWSSNLIGRLPSSNVVCSLHQDGGTIPWLSENWGLWICTHCLWRQKTSTKYWLITKFWIRKNWCLFTDFPLLTFSGICELERIPLTWWVQHQNHPSKNLGHLRWIVTELKYQIEHHLNSIQNGSPFWQSVRKWTSPTTIITEIKV